MLDATALSIGGVASVTDKTEAAKKSLGQTYDQFLTLLTTQLKNQDPLNPMDSKDFTSQLIAMANTEQQIAQTQKTDELIKLTQATAANQALNYIGLDVNYVGDKFIRYDGYSTSIKYNLPADGIKGKITILDSNGQVVWSANPALTAGEHGFVWDGKDNFGQNLPVGSYQVAIAVENADGGAVTPIIRVPGLVSGIDTDEFGQVLLNVGDQKIPISAVTTAYVRGSAS